MRFFLHVIGQKSVTWPKITAKESGSVVFLWTQEKTCEYWWRYKDKESKVSVHGARSPPHSFCSIKAFRNSLKRRDISVALLLMSELRMSDDHI